MTYKFNSYFKASLVNKIYKCAHIIQYMIERVIYQRFTFYIFFNSSHLLLRIFFLRSPLRGINGLHQGRYKNVSM